MLSYFHTPFNDELFYSIAARYQHYLGHLGSKVIVRQLFASNTASAVFDFPSSLQAFYEQLSKGSLLTPEKMITDHTLFPLYRPFLAKAQAESVEHNMRSSHRGNSIHVTIGVMASSIPVLSHLRFCWECVAADR